MPTSYSEDLHWRIVWLHMFMRMEASEVARLLHVCLRTVYRYAERFRLTGEVRKHVKRNGPYPIMNESHELLLVDLLLTKPAIYLRELQHELYTSTGIVMHLSTICRAVRKLGFTRQKMQHIALQQSEAERIKFIAEVMAVFHHSLIVWIDETGCDRRNSLRKYAYGIRGQTPRDYQLQMRGVRYSAIGILSSNGIDDVYITEGSVNGDTFLHFVHTMLLPILNSFDGHSKNSVVIMDNASIYHTDSVVRTIDATGALIRFLPPYSPDMNPIENVFSEVKHYLEANGILFDTSLSPSSVLLMAFNSITASNCKAYIKNAGYT